VAGSALIWRHLLTYIKKTIAQLRGVSRLNSIRSKIIAFSLVATLLPSISMGFLSYRNNLRVLEEKVSKELTSISSQKARELDLWLKERQYELRVFASSYEVAENLDRLSGARPPSSETSFARNRLGDYLKSVGHRFADYDELAVFDRTGAVVATNSQELSDIALPADWQHLVSSEGLVLGEPYWDAKRRARSMVLVGPIRGSREDLLGVIAGRVNLRGIDAILKSQGQEERELLHVITRGGLIVSSFPPPQDGDAPPSLPPAVTKDLFGASGTPTEFVNPDAEEVVGTLAATSRLGWGVVAEKSRGVEYAEVAHIRNFTILLTAAIFAGVGFAAYLLGLSLVRPLERLTKGAGEVATGDLDVDLPVSVGGEVGYLTVVFNRMVARLRKAREEIEATNKALLSKNEELHEISITDGLTGLRNRKHMNETVVSELSRAARHGFPICILMMDIDRFKTFNDTKGHQAGDAVLRGLAEVLRETLRGTDYAARYGGEEFLVLLPHTGLEEALRTAERIRSGVAAGRLGTHADGGAITLSVGVASFPECGSDAEKVIRQADIALYEAKREGRDRVVAARLSTPAVNPAST